MAEESWADDPDALEFIKGLKKMRLQEIEMLVGAARSSTDPTMQRSWAAIAQLEKVIEMMEEERGKPD